MVGVIEAVTGMRKVVCTRAERLREGAPGRGADKGRRDEQMTKIKDPLKSVVDKGQWATRGATFMAKVKATKMVWFPPGPVETGEEAASTAKNATRRTGGAARKTAKKTTGAAKKAGGPQTKAATKRASGGAKKVTSPVRQAKK
jgi:hypothetical protein